MKLAELKKQASALGLSPDQVRQFGDLRCRATWEAAISSTPENRREDLARRTRRLSSLKILGLPDSAADRVESLAVPPKPCPRCLASGIEFRDVSPYSLDPYRFIWCPACQGTGSFPSSAARDPPVDPA